MNSLVLLCSLTLCVLFKEFLWTFARTLSFLMSAQPVVELSRMVGIHVNVWTVPYFPLSLLSVGSKRGK